jgi:hypothetical protein
MNPFGRIGYVKTKQKIAGKFVEKTTKCVHLSHAEDHPHDTYRMYNPMTRAVIVTRNVTWAAWTPSKSQDNLENIFEDNNDGIADRDADVKDIEWADERPPPNVILGDEDDPPARRITQPRLEMIQEHLAGRNGDDDNGETEENEAGRMSIEDGNAEDMEMTEFNPDPPTPTPLSPNARSAKSRKVANAMKKLQGYYNPLATETLDKVTEATVIETEDDLEEENEVAGVVFSATLTSDPGEPKTYREAVEGPAKDKWIPSTKDEVLNFINRDAWKKIERTLVRKLGRKPVPVKWIFKIKEEHHGGLRYKSRIVVKG